MENDIQTSLSSASPIAAYGTSQLSRTPRILFILGCVLGLSLIISFLSLIFVRIPAAKNPSSHIVIHGGVQLPEAAPLSWRESVSASAFPVIIGTASVENHFEPYAVIPRFQPTTRLNRQNYGLFTLVSEHPLETQSESLFSILPKLWSIRSTLAHISLYIYENSNVTAISGGFDGHVWQTNLSINTDETKLSNWSNEINLNIFPQAWTEINQKLSQILNLQDNTRPASFSWETQNDQLSNIKLIYTQAVPTSTAIQVLGNFGIYDTTLLNLPDGTTIEEFQNPTKRFTANTSTNWQGTSGTQISLNGSILEVQQSQPRLAKQSSCDKGQVILRLDSSTISHLVQSLNADQSEISAAITASIQQGKVHICVD